MTILLMRHAERESDDTGVAERDVPLTVNGTRQAAEIACQIKTKLPSPLVVDHILASPYRPALETANIVRDQLLLPVTVTPEEALNPDTTNQRNPQPIAALIERLGAAAPQPTILVVGHQPLLGELGRWWTGQMVSPSHAGVACLDLEDRRGMLRWQLDVGQNAPPASPLEVYTPADKVPELDVFTITRRVSETLQKYTTPEDERRYLAFRWLHRLYYEVRKWNEQLTRLLLTYPGLATANTRADYEDFLQRLRGFQGDLEARDEEQDLSADLRMLHARFRIDFKWLYAKDRETYNAIYDLVSKAYQSEHDILNKTANVLNDVSGRHGLFIDEAKPGQSMSDLTEEQLVEWHFSNYRKISGIILEYDKTSKDVVELLKSIFEKFGAKLLSIEEYALSLRDPSRRSDVMLLGEPAPKGRESGWTVQMSNRQLNTLIAAVIGSAFLLIVLGVVLFVPEPTVAQLRIISTLLAIGAGGFAAMLPGAIETKLTLGKRLMVGAAGAFAVFVLVYFFVPATG